MYLSNIVSYNEALDAKQRVNTKSNDVTVNKSKDKKIQVSRNLIQKCALCGLLGLVLTGCLYYFEVFPKGEEVEISQA